MRGTNNHMIRLTLTTSFPLAILLLCGSPSRIEAQGNTPITIKDGSIVLHADGLDDAARGIFALLHTAAG